MDVVTMCLAASKEGAPPEGMVRTALVRDVVETLRGRIRAGDAVAESELAPEAVAARVCERWHELRAAAPRRVINATGVIVHTNLGRAPLAEPVVDRLAATARGYTDLEFRLSEGRRGSRQDHVAGQLRLLTGAEDALAVNNNAAAVLLALAATARGREVVISRGELVEIGGSFRIPDVLAQSGAVLREVGTTNRTHLADYREALGPDTGLLLQVHTSNYRVEGFTARVELEELVRLGRDHGVPVMVDLGSGALLDAPAGLRPEPVVREVLDAGPDLVTFSGDKMLGGPQAGLVVGRADAVEALRRHPLARAVRIDKLLLGALQATLGLYLEGTARETVPVLRMLFAPLDEVAARAESLAARLREAIPGTEVTVEDDVSPVGGGSFPGEGVPTRVVALGEGAVRVVDGERELRAGDPPVVARIRDGRLILDPRTMEPTEEDGVPALVRAAWERAGSPAGKG